jgi:hypothetical protein
MMSALGAANILLAIRAPQSASRTSLESASTRYDYFADDEPTPLTFAANIRSCVDNDIRMGALGWNDWNGSTRRIAGRDRASMRLRRQA